MELGGDWGKEGGMALTGAQTWLSLGSDLGDVRWPAPSTVWCSASVRAYGMGGAEVLGSERTLGVVGVRPLHLTHCT
jgi:hypothetical protein